MTDKTDKRRRRAPKEDLELPEDYPLRHTMASQMHVELVVNDDAGVWVLHDQPFPAILHWAEYDEENNELTFITHDGKIQDLGMKIPNDIGDILLDADEICAMYMKDGKVQDIGIVPIMVRDTVFH